MTRDHKVIHTFPQNEKVVGITQCQEMVFIATERMVYKVVNDKLIPLEIVTDSAEIE